MKKITACLILSITLLFTFSYAGTLTVNGDTYDIGPNYSDYTINYGTKYALVKHHFNYDPDYWIGLYMPDSNMVSDIDCLLLYPSTYGGYTPSYDLFSVSNNDGYRSIISFSGLTAFWYPTSSSPNGVYPDATMPSNWMNAVYDLDILHCDWNIYETSGANGDVGFILGEQVYPDSHGGGGRHFFDPTPSAQEINDNVYNVISSSSVFDNLPKNYTDYFVIYDEISETYWGYFYPNNVTATGYIYDNTDSHPTYKVEFTKPWYSSDHYVYMFYFSGDEYNFGSVYFFENFSDYEFDFVDNPVVYTSKDFPFYTVVDGVVNDTPDFVLHPSDITNNGSVVTLEDIIDNPKDSNSIWSMLFNIFNPPNEGSGDIADIENAHNGIIANSDTGQFFGFFRDYNHMLDFSGTSWLLTASAALFAHFSGFLILCCFFITIGRLLR